MSKPIFVFVPGGGCTPDVYDYVISGLSKEGFASVKVSLPSVEVDPPIYDMTEDIKAVKKAITNVAEDGRDVVLVMHSYAGMPGAQAVEGLGKKDRADKGLTGGVVRMVFLSAFMFPEGFVADARGETKGFPPIMKVDLEVCPAPRRRRS